MRSFLARHWFLAALVGGVILAVAFPGPAGWLTAWMPPRVVIVAALFLMAFTMPSRRLAGELLYPWGWLWATLISFGLMPALAWLLGRLPLHDDLLLGLLLVCSLPCTLASAVLWTRLAGGNEATALAATLSTNLMGWCFSTLWILWTTGVVLTVSPAAMMLDLAVILIAPVAAGQLARLVPVFHRLAESYRQPLGYVSQLFILAIIVQSAAKLGGQLHEGSLQLSAGFLALTAALAGGLHLTGLFLGLASSRLLGLDRPRQVAVALAGSQKTLPVGIYLFERYFQASHPLALAPLLFYHAGQLLLDTLVVRWIKVEESKVGNGGARAR